MSDVKHTPKWRVREVLKSHSDGSTTLEAYEVLEGREVVVTDVDTEEHARLIAAAPTMVAALEAIVAPYAGISDQRLFSTLYEHEAELIVDARAAVKAARGQP